MELYGVPKSKASTMDGALSKLLKPPTSQREGPCMLEHHEAGRAF